MMSNDDDTHERSTTNINTTISGTSKRNMILTPPAAAPATPSTSVAIQNATPSTSVAIQNDHEDVSGIRNPTSKKRRLNVSYLLTFCVDGNISGLVLAQRHCQKKSGR